MFVNFAVKNGILVETKDLCLVFTFVYMSIPLIYS